MANPFGAAMSRRKATDKPSTTLVLAGRDPTAQHGFVNTPIYRGSTILSETVEDFLHRKDRRYTYGRRGTPTSDALAEAWQAIEGGAGAAFTPSGLSAVALGLTAVLSAGDHLLMVDTAYGPTRSFCDKDLKRLGVTTTYYDPLIGAGIEELFRPETRAVFCESPGSLTFEVQDVPAIAAVAHARGAAVLLDNTWATPLLFDAYRHGVDVVVSAGTKYLSGHSDVNIGVASANAEHWPAVFGCHGRFGLCAGPEDLFLSLRGLRTMGVRLAHQEQAALRIADWLAERPEVARVLHPALPSCPGHEFWQRDFSGSSGLFAIVLKAVPLAAAHAFVDGLRLFGIGASWGGYESLAIPFEPLRTATTWEAEGPAIRFNIGLEDVGDLIDDLEAGLGRLPRE
jgi:cystathionine beta-lyase